MRVSESIRKIEVSSLAEIRSQLLTKGTEWKRQLAVMRWLLSVRSLAAGLTPTDLGQVDRENYAEHRG